MIINISFFLAMKASVLLVLLALVAICVAVVPQKGTPVTFRAVAPEVPTQAKRGYSVSVSPSSGPAGTQVTVSFSADTVENTWVGLFPKGSYSTNSFKYLPAASGTLTLSTSGLAGGDYDVYLVYNSYIQSSTSYSVTGGSTSGSSSGGGSTSGSSGGGGGNADQWLQSHNTRRAAYGMPALQWSSKLASSAQNWANTMASQNNMHHSGTNGVGENIAYGYGSIEDVLRAWADEEAQNYDPSSKQCSAGVCGHFTQVMWRSTNLVGCGTAYSGGTPFYACQYIRPGNCNNYDYTQSNSPCPLFDDSSL